ncbi:MAG: tetratricopeptide repeat protein [Polaromonas sp.]|uniref:tetratricopeptide repeat protein n=1 Tax=Polaromonas sp. TaxID=1869339 RepID=UPI0027365949|nr:tetratricopeptide repeat protein [Polaromonas sp.]MDP2816829.1 tetratricopeptide repeat protein [Polaromonas sp.]
MSRAPKFIPQPQKAAGPAAQVQERLMQAVALQRQGKLDKARALYAQVLQMQPANFDALHLLGVVEFSAGQPAKAADLIGRAIMVNPNNAPAHHNHGTVMAALQQHEASAQSHLRAAALNPGFSDAHCAAANALAMLGRHQEARDSYDSALAVRPDLTQVWNNRGNVLAALGQSEAALASFGKAIELQPDFVDAHDNRGLALHAAGRLAQAVESHDRALALNPDRAQAHFGRGSALQAMARHGEAVGSYDRAISLRPAYAMAYYNRGLSLLAMKLYEKAVASYDQWLAFQPLHPEALNNRGIALRGLGQHQAALESYERALAVRQAYADAWSNHGVALTDLGRHAEAFASYERVLAMDPSDPEAHLNLGICALQSGDFERGWPEYEWRLKCTQQDPAGIRDFPQPRWSGAEPLEGKTILLHAEQGLGDTLQFKRYAKEVAGLGARVILEVQPALLGLLRELEGVTELVGRGHPLPPFDCHCALMSLPLAFKTRLHSIPPAAAGLSGAKAVAGRTGAWEVRLGVKTRPRVGLAWSGSPTHKNDHNRSVALSDLLAALPQGVQYVSLQKEVREADAATLAAHPDILHLGDELQDFTDTAALCGLMDLVISVDTSVAHLAGTLGCETWVLLPFNPDWRWMLERTDTPWYPDVVLYRQELSGNWEAVLKTVGEDLASALS